MRKTIEGTFIKSEYQYGQTVYNQDGKSDRAFIVEDGHFEISVKYNMKPNENDEDEIVRDLSIPHILHNTKRRRT